MSSICEGYLFKKGEGVGLSSGFRERKRWFVLDVSKKELSYYKEPPRLQNVSRSSASAAVGQSQSSSAFMLFSPRGSVPSAASALPRMEPLVGLIELPKARMVDTAQISAGVFAIVLPHRIYELRAANEEEAKKWVASLQSLMPGSSRRAIPRSSTAASVQASKVRDAAPWCVEAVWLDGSEDVPLDITAHIGTLPEDRSFAARVRLSDGTTYMVDSKDFHLDDGHSHEIAATGESKLFGKLIPSSGQSLPPPPATSDAPILEGGGGSAVVPEVALALRTLYLLLGAAFCAGGSLAITFVGMFGRALLSTLLMTAACVALGSCWKDVAAALQPRRAPQKPSKIVAPLLEAAPCSYDLVLHAVKEVPRRDADNGSSALSKVPTAKRAMSIIEFLEMDLLPPSGVNFSGKWKLNVTRSSDPTEMLTALGVPWIARKALAAASRTVEVEHEGLAWTETVTTAVITKTTSFSLDGSPYQEMSPVDKSVIQMATQYEEDGQCVATKATFSGGVKTQEIKRYLIDDGATYYIVNKLSIRGGTEVESASYFEKVTS